MGHRVRWCAFTDASKGKDGVGGGVWEGVQAERSRRRVTGLAARMQRVRREAGKGEGVAETERGAVGAGLWGEKLPDTWEVYDAEMYMVVRYLQAVLRRLEEGEATNAEGDVIVVSDSLSALRELEDAWRSGEVPPTARGAAMLEAACRIRETLRARWNVGVVCVWCPGHRIPYNSYADAVAKVSCTKARVDNTRWLVALTRGRTCAYAVQAGERTELRNGTVYREVRKGIQGWVRARVGAAETGDAWDGVMTAVSRGCARRGTAQERDTGADERGGQTERDDAEGEAREAAQRAVLARQQLTYAVREGNAVWAEHGRAWERWYTADVARGAVTKTTLQGARTCTACGAERCRVMHVCTGACTGIQRRDGYVQTLMEAVERVAAVLPKVRKGEVCRAHAQVRRAVVMLRVQRLKVEAGEIGSDAGDGVGALENIIAGRMAEPSGIVGQGDAERRAVAWRVAAAIGQVQDVVIAMVERYKAKMCDRWAAVRAEVDEEWGVECERRRCEEQELQERRARQAQVVAQRRRDDAEAEALRAMMAERARRDEARAGAGAATTRRMAAAGAALVAGIGESAVPSATQVRRVLTGSETASMLCAADAAMREQRAGEEYNRAQQRRRGLICVGSDTAALLWDIEQEMKRSPGTAEPRATTTDEGREPAGNEGGTTRGDVGRKGKHSARKRQKTAVRVSSMRDATRWRVEERGGGCSMYHYRDEDNVERPRYEVRESEMMRTVMDETSRDGGMKGLYAARRYEPGEVITVYVGEVIGRMGEGGGEEMERRVAAGGGRHVMALSGGVLMDGVKGYTGAQYINAAYRVPSRWWNNAKFANTGTVTATQVIPEGREILMAYHSAYWKRWGPAVTLGRPRKPTVDGDRCDAGVTIAASGAAGETDDHKDEMDGAANVAEGAETPQLHLQPRRRQALHAGGRAGERVTVPGNGVRIVVDGTHGASSGQGKRRVTNRAPDADAEASESAKRVRTAGDGRWTPTAYDAFVQRVVRRERGEGGGVT